MEAGTHIRFGLLGPIEAIVDGHSVPLGGTKQRALLAALLLARGETVSADRLAEALWGPDPPSTAVKTLQVHVSRLRRDVPGLALHTRPPGYVLEVEPGALDLERFEEGVEEGRRLLSGGEPARAADALRGALGLWRGAALADLALEPVADQASIRLDEQRLAALEDRLEADLRCGRHTEVIAELRRLVDKEPLRERLWVMLMLALYRAERQGDALSAYQDARRKIVEELGIEPGPRLRELERQILDQDPALDLPAAPAPRRDPRTTPARRRRRLRNGLTVTALVAVGVVAGLVLASDGRHAAARRALPSLHVVSNSVARIDIRSGRVERVIHVGRQPDEMAVTANAVWVASRDSRTVTRIDRRDGHVDTIKGLPGAASIATTPVGGIFVSSFERYVWFIPEQTLVPRRVLALPGQAEALAVGAGSLWVASPASERGAGIDRVVRLDGPTNRVTQKIRVGDTPIFETFGYGRLWTSNYDGDSVSVIEPGRSRAKTIVVGDGPLGIAAGEGGVWVVHFSDRELWRIDPESLKVVARIPVGNGPLAVTARGGFVWVTNREDGTIQQIDPLTNRVKRTFHVGLAPYGVEVADNKLWVTINRE